MRVLEICRGLDFLDEALGAKDRGEFGTQDFDGDFALVLQVLSEVDGRHASFAEVALDFVAIGEGGREAGGDLGHQAKIIRSVQC